MTTPPKRAVRRSGKAHAILDLFELLDRRKALRIVWELRSNRRLAFRELVELCETNPGVLNTRLKELREARFVEHDQDGYALTAQGEALLGHLLPLYKWAERWRAALRAEP